MIIKLTEEEIVRGAMVGAQRNAKKMVNGVRPILPNNCPDSQVWENISEGACAEIAVAKHLGVEYDPGYAGAFDVGQFDVRQSCRQEGHLLIQKYDKDRLTIAVFGRFGTYRIAGCFYNTYAKQPKYWGNPKFQERPCYAVPEADLIKLTTMDELEKYRHQCDVRQLLVYHFTDKEKFRKVIEIRGKDNQAYRDFIDQGMKGNRGNQDEWYE